MNNRLMRVPVSYEFIVPMLRIGYISPHSVCVRGIPESAVFEYDYYDSKERLAYFVFSHPSFEELLPGDEIPVVDIEFKRIGEW